VRLSPISSVILRIILQSAEVPGYVRRRACTLNCICPIGTTGFLRMRSLLHNNSGSCWLGQVSTAQQ